MKPVKFLLKAATKSEKIQWLTAIAQRSGNLLFVPSFISFNLLSFVLNCRRSSESERYLDD
jgi:hypothetical protein